MVDFLNFDTLSYIYIHKMLLKLMEKIARYKHHTGFINMYVDFNVISRVFQVKFYSNILDLQVTKILRNCSRKLMLKTVSKSNSEKRKILNDVIYYKNYLFTFYFDESKELLDYINIKQLKVLQKAKFLHVPKVFRLLQHQILLIGDSCKLILVSLKIFFFFNK